MAVDLLSTHGTSMIWRRVLGGIATVWGGALLVQHFLRARAEHFDRALVTGRVIAYAGAGVVFLVGLSLLFRPGKRGAS